MSGGAATALARAVVQALVDAGVRELVVAPGSRNAPLSFAAWDAAAAGAVGLHTRVDERSAAFLALGLTRGGSRAAVLCTSGTAVANLLPAVLEAAHAGVPLVAVTADRPARLRGTGANQTTDQVGLLGPLVASRDLGSPSDLADPADGPGGDGPGRAGVPALLAVRAAPLHLNVRLDDPLLPEAAERWAPDVSQDREQPPRHPRPTGEPTVLPLGPRTVVVAGDDAGPPARQLAERAGWPLLAEPSSGARTGDHALRCYRLLLDGPLGRRVERVVVWGHPTLSRPVTRLLGRADVEVLSVPARGAWAVRPFAAVEVARPVVDGPDDADDDGWLEEWRRADREVGRRLDALLAAEPGLTPHAVAEATWRALPPGGLLHVGASNPIRDLDVVARPHPVGERRLVLANRGLSGIDGTVSSAIGAALGRPHSTRALALMGDVTLLHDANGLVLGPDEPRPDLTIVVANDDGGSIFAGLEQGAPAHADRFERLFGTPHGVDLAALCAATRTPYLRVDSLPALEQALAGPNGGVEVVEAVVRRDTRRDLDARLRALGAGY